MIINVANVTTDFNTYRTARVKSLFNAERGDKFIFNVELPIEDIDWQIGLIVGPSGTGGSVYWLNSGIDRGDIAYQEWCFIDQRLRSKRPEEAAKELWRNSLFDIGLKLFGKALCDIQAGKIVRKPQDDRFATYEPSTELEKIYKPDLLMLKGR